VDRNDLGKVEMGAAHRARCRRVEANLGLAGLMVIRPLGSGLFMLTQLPSTRQRPTHAITVIYGAHLAIHTSLVSSHPIALVSIPTPASLAVTLVL
jgi:hypothetical protein